MGMLGGGVTAAATYRKDAESFTITLVADSPMVSGLGAQYPRCCAQGTRPLRLASLAQGPPFVSLRSLRDRPFRAPIAGR